MRKIYKSHQNGDTTGSNKWVYVYGSPEFTHGREQDLDYYGFAPALHPNCFHGFIPWNLLGVLGVGS